MHETVLDDLHLREIQRIFMTSRPAKCIGINHVFLPSAAEPFAVHKAPKTASEAVGGPSKPGYTVGHF